MTKCEERKKTKTHTQKKQRTIGKIGCRSKVSTDVWTLSRIVGRQILRDPEHSASGTLLLFPLLNQTPAGLRDLVSGVPAYRLSIQCCFFVDQLVLSLAARRPFGRSQVSFYAASLSLFHLRGFSQILSMWLSSERARQPGPSFFLLGSVAGTVAVLRSVSLKRSRL